MGSTKRPYKIDPAVAHERAKIAARSRTTPEHYVAKLVAAAPALSLEQRAKLAALLLNPASDGAEAA